jgi:hypothetical protein
MSFTSDWRGQWLPSPREEEIEMDSSKVANVTCGLRELSDAELVMVSGGKFDWSGLASKLLTGTAAALGAAVGGTVGAVIGGCLGHIAYEGAKLSAEAGDAGTNFYF